MLHPSWEGSFAMRLRQADRLLVMLCLVALSSCGKKVSPGTAVAVQDDLRITVEELEQELSALPPAGRKQLQSIDRLKEYVRSYARQRRLAAEATRRGLDKDPRVQTAVRRAYLEALNASLERELEQSVSITDEEVEKYQREHPPAPMLTRDFQHATFESRAAAEECAAAGRAAMGDKKGVTCEKPLRKLLLGSEEVRRLPKDILMVLPRPRASSEVLGPAADAGGQWHVVVALVTSRPGPAQPRSYVERALRARRIAEQREETLRRISDVEHLSFDSSIEKLAERLGSDTNG